jgi:hypothetical protein
LPGIFIDNPTRDVLFLATQVMITSVAIASGETTARQVANEHRRFTIDTQAFDVARFDCSVIFF